jgi:hypothetical protein
LRVSSVSKRSINRGQHCYNTRERFRTGLHAFEGPLGDILHNGRSFFAWKEGRLIGAYTTLEEAMESLCAAEETSISPARPRADSDGNRAR